MQEIFRYTAYDQSIESEFQLPLPKTGTDVFPNIVVKSDKLAEPEFLLRTLDGVHYNHGENDIFIKWNKLGSFKVDDGREIIVDPAPSIHPSDNRITIPLLGTVSAIALFQKGYTVLHGGAVTVGNKTGATLFLGGKREGKSTMIGYLMKEGYRIISDDICPIISSQQNIFSVLPSFPKIKLWPNSLEFLNEKPHDHEKVHPDFDKRNLTIDNLFHNEITSVSSIIILGTADKIDIARIKGVQAIQELMPHMIINRFTENQPKTIQKSIYYQVIEIVRHIPVYKLTRPRDLHLLPAIAALIEKTSLYESKIHDNL